MTARLTLNPDHVRRRFDKAAGTFAASDFVHRVTREGLFSRLEPLTVDARLAIDLGCGTGAALADIRKRFSGSRVVGVDLSAGMLRRATRQGGWWSRPSVVQADARALPFADRSVDVVFANMLLPWIDDLPALGAEVSRVLRKEGLFAFATLGPDSLLELRRAWQQVDSDEHVRTFPDMHDVGDALLGCGLRDPVLDVDRLRVSYRDSGALLRDLVATATRNTLAGRRATLTGRQRLRRFRSALEASAPSGTLELDLELVYGHCFGSGERAGGGIATIDPGSIPLRKRG
jgi:malonyl-CoA O-methyltransferase